ncbi:MAG: 2-succinyl-5-enolpyruvyl-6-hydroxy-3-cyclohexene-carboxylate synthase, partial [Solirubrobacteraceae bacterium]|nr:2-succinyl-5-enolpyruvyl-6-hydroxy-3-cyclohexene-carboxylate synthase [Solirubrobacteraceae bacterium]
AFAELCDHGPPAGARVREPVEKHDRRAHGHIMTATDTYLLLRAFCDELARCGMRAACTAPGSRSAPLVLSLVREARLSCFSHLDERCAGFFALGLAKASGLPVAVACTSGTAAVELAPAVYEAHEARVPLLVLTADRPPELRETGAGQTIDQVKLYGGAAKWFFEVGVHDATPQRLAWIRQLACRAYWTALEGRPGAVHLNFPLREPLVLEQPLPDDDTGRGDGAPALERAPADPRPAPDPLAKVLAEIEQRPRGVIVCGRWERGTALGAAVAGFSETAGYPVLADPLSGARREAAAVAHYDALLRAGTFAQASAPELVLRVGDLPTSKPLRAWLAAAGDALQVTIDCEHSWQDPDGVVSYVLPADPATALAELNERVQRAPHAAWVERWRDADACAAEAIAGALGGELSEPRVAAELGARLPVEATLFVASSMPVRDVETFFPARDAPPRVLSNRGANGIDGTVSAAFGAAAAGDGPVVLLIGDVALAHDVGGLRAAGRLGLKLVVVLLNNDGGGIFHFLPVAGEQDAFEEHVATPHGLDFAHAAELYGCAHEIASDPDGFGEALERALAAERSTIIEVRTDREANVALHRRVWDAVADAL